MNPQIQAIPGVVPAEPVVYPITSRYYGIETKEITLPSGDKAAYLKRRFVPQPERFELLQYHTVTEGDRLDNVAARYLDDPEQFWRIADANRAMHPDALTATVGRKLRITLPEGIPGVRNA
ncbi:MAG: LysM domain-containing protein [Leptolyngbya sp. SIO1D8]|nr:LysM domain-containing protein [Leptolyngbya sp. SIO1D8]